MEKNIKMSLETARDLWKLLKQHANPDHMAVFHIIKENFTKEELEGDEGYTWEKAFSGGGHYISSSSIVEFTEDEPNDFSSKNIFKTEPQAKSALAFAQLSHIVAKYNEGMKIDSNWWSIDNYKDDGLTVWEWGNYKTPLMFYRKEDAETSLRVNRELWEQYHML